MNTFYVYNLTTLAITEQREAESYAGALTQGLEAGYALTGDLASLQEQQRLQELNWVIVPESQWSAHDLPTQHWVANGTEARYHVINSKQYKCEVSAYASTGRTVRWYVAS